MKRFIQRACILLIFPSGGEAKTEPASSLALPEWNINFTFDVTDEDHDKELLLEVVRENEDTAEAVSLGFVTIDVAAVLSDQQRRKQWLPLRPYSADASLSSANMPAIRVCMLWLFDVNSLVARHQH